MLHYVHFFNLGRSKIACIRCLIAQCQGAIHYLCFKAEGNDLILVAIGVGEEHMRAGIDAEQSTYPYLQAGFFLNLPYTCLGNALPSLHVSTWEAPAPIVASASQQYFLSCCIEDDR